MTTRTFFTVTLLTVLFAGCVAQPVAPTPAAIAAEVKAGDRIRLVTSGGSEGDYRVVRVDRESLYVQPTGRNHNDPKQSIAFSDIRKVSVIRTNNQAMGVGFVIGTIVVGAALYEAMESAAAAALCC